MNDSSSEQSVSWFCNQYREGSLDIRPPYQRRPVWAARQKCYLIESILLRLPVPEVYIQQSTSPEGKTTNAVVDGQQRIRTILQFIGVDAEEQEQNKFILDKLNEDSKWKNVSFAELQEDEKIQFYGYRFSVRYLNTDSDREVRDMFGRLNRFLTPLSPQELRNAVYTGPFIKLAERLADDEYWAENKIVTAAAIRRMGDIQFISELVIGVLHGPQGGSSKDVDEYYKQYEDYDEDFPNQRKTHRLFNATLATIQEIMPNIKDTRWANKTDFYTLFVAVSHLLASARKLINTKATRAKRALVDFADEVDKRLGDEESEVGKDAVRYVRAVEKGANDKKRRADRHLALLNIIDPFFRVKK